jgi:SPP1 family predicted phage head-tail adaptor
MRSIKRYDRKVLISLPALAVDSTGAPVAGYGAQKEVWCRRSDVGSREVRTSSALRSETTTIFTLRWFAGLDEKARFECEGQIYDIFPPTELGRRQEWEVQAKKREGQA